MLETINQVRTRKHNTSPKQNSWKSFCRHFFVHVFGTAKDGIVLVLRVYFIHKFPGDYSALMGGLTCRVYRSLGGERSKMFFCSHSNIPAFWGTLALHPGGGFARFLFLANYHYGYIVNLPPATFSPSRT